MLNSVDDVIDALGGPAATAAVAGIGASGVSNWRTRGKISPAKFILIKEALAAKQLEVDPSVFGFKTTEEART
jgi:hypothetical protein